MRNLSVVHRLQATRNKHKDKLVLGGRFGYFFVFVRGWDSLICTHFVQFETNLGDEGSRGLVGLSLVLYVFRLFWGLGA